MEPICPPLVQGKPQQRAQAQRRFDGEITIVILDPGRCSRLLPPMCDRIFGEPNCKASSIAKRGVVVLPISHAVLLTGIVTPSPEMKLERYEKSPRPLKRELAHISINA